MGGKVLRIILRCSSLMRRLGGVFDCDFQAYTPLLTRCSLVIAIDPTQFDISRDTDTHVDRIEGSMGWVNIG